MAMDDPGVGVPSSQVFSDPQMCWCTLRYSMSPIIIYDFLLEYHKISSSVAEQLLPIWSSWTTVMMKGCIIKNHTEQQGLEVPWISVPPFPERHPRPPWWLHCRHRSAPCWSCVKASEALAMTRFTEPSRWIQINLDFRRPNPMTDPWCWYIC